MTVSSTGYCLQGNTATGVPTSSGVVAVDPSVIPLGTRMYVPGYGEGVAADTGCAVKGHDDRRLVPDLRAGDGLGPQDGHDHAALS